MSSLRWKTLLTKVIEQDKSNVIQLATIDSLNRPHVRSHIVRAIVDLPSSSSPHPLILSSTDIRTPKVSQLVHSFSVEFVLWAEKTQEQYRVAGRATLVPPPTHPTYAHFQPHFPLGLDWEQKRREMFNAMGAHMRASWHRPTPGSPLESYDKAKEWPMTLPKLEDAQTEEEKKQVEFAFGNFAMVIIEPVDVDYVELGKVPNQRTRFFREGEEWREQILVP